MVRQSDDGSPSDESMEAGEIEIQSDKDIRIVTGSRRKFQPPIPIKKTEKSIKIKADRNMFGIVTHEETDKDGQRVYIVERYQIPRGGKVTLKTNPETGEVLVFLEGENDPLTAVVMRYVEEVGEIFKKYF